MAKNLRVTVSWETERRQKKHWWSKAKPVSMSVTHLVDTVEMNLDDTGIRLKAERGYVPQSISTNLDISIADPAEVIKRFV